MMTANQDIDTEYSMLLPHKQFLGYHILLLKLGGGGITSANIIHGYIYIKELNVGYHNQ
jgi:hypothetical protein